MGTMNMFIQKADVNNSIKKHTELALAAKAKCIMRNDLVLEWAIE